MDLEKKVVYINLYYLLKNYLNHSSNSCIAEFLYISSIDFINSNKMVTNNQYFFLNNVAWFLFAVNIQKKDHHHGIMVIVC